MNYTTGTLSSAVRHATIFITRPVLNEDSDQPDHCGPEIEDFDQCLSGAWAAQTARLTSCYTTERAVTAIGRTVLVRLGSRIV